MAEEAFALSPISARAAQPSEEDYAAISEAFMETSRGRWFLGEYAKRNRNADTRMVLDAVARIEESLAAQRKAAADACRDEQLEQVLGALRGVIESAQASALAALDGVSFEQTLAPVRKGVRVIREISWRLREIGNDGRICDIIDSQVSAIEAGAARLSMDEAKGVLDAAFATLTRRLAEFNADEAVTAAEPDVAEAAVAEPAAPAPSPPPAAASAASDAVTAEPPPAQDAAEPMPASEFVAPAAAEADLPSPDDTALARAEAAPAEAEAAELARVTEKAAADAQDEAVLDLIAAEMGAPDPIDEEAIAEEIRAAKELRVAEAMAAEPDMAVSAPEPMRMPEPVHVARPARVLQPVGAPMAAARTVEAPVSPPASPVRAEAAPEPNAEISLGSSIIASGLVKRPILAANDPLAPIRRMSQSEKIAFFS
ncbi:hypothetical protein J6500_29925 [Bradyrhizobium sp. WSM 1704]|uniref:hypothetical protein n=1 Tax=Bradyrhizobium semiaridum TaxID=2821404 RepID=UPI001CE2BDC4|nr:hypothetical protein [Bradyrhizobium semiaridum]MCA6126078.1 hypothetical protein [Bradyrhizobium semiaridum]